jgi:hypothetical protein
MEFELVLHGFEIELSWIENFPRVGIEDQKQMRIVQENELDNPSRFVIID